MATATQTKTSTSSGKMENAMDLLIHEMADIRSAEKIFLGMLETGAENATHGDLRRGLEAHRKQTEGHIKNVDAAFEAMGISPQEVECKGAKGLEGELQSALEERPAPEVLDALIAGGAAKTENYEITAYSGMVDLAKQLGENDVAKLLEKNLKEEEETLKKVEKVEETIAKKLPAPPSA